MPKDYFVCPLLSSDFQWRLCSTVPAQRRWMTPHQSSWTLHPFWSTSSVTGSEVKKKKKEARCADTYLQWKMHTVNVKMRKKCSALCLLQCYGLVGFLLQVRPTGSAMKVRGVSGITSEPPAAKFLITASEASRAWRMCGHPGPKWDGNNHCSCLNSWNRKKTYKLINNLKYGAVHLSTVHIRHVQAFVVIFCALSYYCRRNKRNIVKILYGMWLRSQYAHIGQLLKNYHH